MGFWADVGQGIKDGFSDAGNDMRKIFGGTTDEEKKDYKEDNKTLQDRIKVNEEYMKDYGVGWNPFLTPFIGANPKTGEQEVKLPELRKAEGWILWIILGFLAFLVIKD